jgi:hypothetical protein
LLPKMNEWCPADFHFKGVAQFSYKSMEENFGGKAIISCYSADSIEVKILDPLGRIYLNAQVTDGEITTVENGVSQIFPGPRAPGKFFRGCLHEMYACEAGKEMLTFTGKDINKIEYSDFKLIGDIAFPMNILYTSQDKEIRVEWIRVKETS